MAKTRGVYQRGETWWITYNIGGRQYRKSAKTTRKEEAVALRNKILTEIFEGKFFPDKKDGDLTISGLKDMWLEASHDKKTIDQDERRLDVISAFFGATALVTSLKAEDVDALKRHLKDKTGLKPATVNRYLAVLRSSLRLASRRGNHHRNPMAGVRFYREDNQRDRICSAAEYSKLTNAATPDLRLAIMIAYYTGMRLGEIANLRRDQLDLQNRMMRLRRGDTKESAAKQVPIPNHLLDELRKRAARIDGRILGATSNSLSSQFGDLTRSLGVRDLRFHDLRHTAVTNLRRAGVDIMTIKAITGHKTLKTLERYNQVSSEDLANAIGRLSLPESAA